MNSGAIFFESQRLGDDLVSLRLNIFSVVVRFILKIRVLSAFVLVRVLDSYFFFKPRRNPEMSRDEDGLPSSFSNFILVPESRSI